MQVQATATPALSNGAFTYTNVNLPPGVPLNFGAASNGVAGAAATYTLPFSDPSNPNSGPTPGSLTNLSFYYPPSTSMASALVPLFGMSCYYTALESDWGVAPNNCQTSPPINGYVYQNSVINPYGLSGTYCSAFIEYVVLQGAGITANGTAVQYNVNTNKISAVAQITSADNKPLVAGQTVARDRRIIPAKGVTIETDGLGTNLHADDTGGAIVGYRLDYFGGIGKASRSGSANANDNPMTVGACTPAQAGCPSK